MKNQTIAFLIGILVTLILLQLDLCIISNFIVKWKYVFLISVIVFILLLWLLYKNLDFFAMKLFNTVIPKYTDFTNMVDKLIIDMVDGDTKDVRESAVNLSNQILLKYAEASTRRWMVTIIFGISSLLIGFFSIVLLNNQNEIMKQQTLMQERQDIENGFRKTLTKLREANYSSSSKKEDLLDWFCDRVM